MAEVPGWATTPRVPADEQLAVINTVRRLEAVAADPLVSAYLRTTCTGEAKMLAQDLEARLSGRTIEPWRPAG